MEPSKELQEKRKELDQKSKEISLAMSRHKFGIMFAIFSFGFAVDIVLLTLIPMNLSAQTFLWSFASVFALFGIGISIPVAKNLISDKKRLREHLNEEMEYYRQVDKELAAQTQSSKSNNNESAKKVAKPQDKAQQPSTTIEAEPER